MNTLPGGNSR